MSDAFVSVILPTHRRAALLPRAVDAVLAQTHRSLELLVVDDGPDPTTERLVAGHPDLRVRYLRHATNRGVSAARNTGILAAAGDMVAFLDDDDEWRPEKLERQVAVLAAAPAEVGAVACYERWEDAAGAVHDRRVLLHGRMHRQLLRHDRVHLQTLLVRRTCFDRVGLFDERLWSYEDMDLALRLARRYEFRTVPEPLVLGHATPASLSRTTPRRIRSLELFIEKHPEIRDHRDLRSHWLVRLARLHAELGDTPRWDETLREAVRTDPANVRAIVAWTAGRLGEPAAHLALARARGRLFRAVRHLRAPQAAAAPASVPSTAAPATAGLHR